MSNRDKLIIRPNGEVSDLIFDFGWGCGNAEKGIRIGFEKYKDKNIEFDDRGGVLNKVQVKEIINYLNKYVNKCKMIKNKINSDNDERKGK